MTTPAQLQSMSVAAVQFCAGPDWSRNRAQLEQLLPQAEGAELVLLPENFACYGGDYRKLAEASDEVREWLAGWAQRLGATLVAGSLPQHLRADGSDVPAPRVRAASLVFAPDGRLQARYDKLHLFDVDVADAQGRYCESATFEPGERLVMTDIAGVPTGLAICYDLRFASLALALALRGARLLLYPSAFTQVTGAAHWELLLRTRAVETGCHVLAANQCGQHNERRASYGHSLLVDPWGQVAARLDAAPGVLRAELDLARQQDIRNNLPLLTQQRLDVELPHGIAFEHQS